MVNFVMNRDKYKSMPDVWKSKGKQKILQYFAWGIVRENGDRAGLLQGSMSGNGRADQQLLPGTTGQRRSAA